MLKSVTLRFKLGSYATQEELSLIREEIICYFEKASLKPEEVICRKGSTEIMIIFAGALYVTDRIFAGALGNIGEIFLTWITNKFSRSPQSSMPLVETELRKLTKQHTEGSGIVSVPISETIPEHDFQLFDRILGDDDGEAEICYISESIGKNGLPVVLEGKLKILKLNGEIVGVEISNSKIEKSNRSDGRIIETQAFESRSYKSYKLDE